VKLSLEIDLDELTGDVGDEVGRILRYWGGSAKQLDWTTAFEYPVSDSEYKQVGSLRLAEAS